MLSKTPKKIWYDDEKWSVVKVYSPCKNEDYLVLKRTDPRSCHSGGGDVTEMCMIDAHNDTFYLSTPLNDKIMQSIKTEIEATVHHNKLRYEALANSTRELVVSNY